MAEKPGRNDPCPCGSGKKFKQCCFLKNPTGKRIIKATLISNAAKPIDLMERTFGAGIAKAKEADRPVEHTEQPKTNEEHSST